MNLSIPLKITAFLVIGSTVIPTFANAQVTTQNEKVYRFYSEKFRSHFYTNNEAEKNTLINDDTNWCYEGVAYALPKDKSDTRPLFRFYSKKFQSHFYTTATAEKNALIANDPNWTYEGVAYHVPKSNDGKSPIYRFYSKNYNAHFYTMSQNEKDSLIANDPNWQFEGIAFYTDKNPTEAPETPCGRPQPIGEVGPDIAIGLDEYTKDDIREDPITLSANKTINLINKDEKIIATIGKDLEIEIYYDGDQKLKVAYDDNEFLVEKEILLEAQSQNDDNTLIFDISRQNSSYKKFRHSMKIRYNNTHKRIWTINILPMELYIWGIGEITATGPEEYNKLMTVAFRTYGYWKLLNSTAYAVQGFNVVGTPANQIYRGYSWEKDHPRIREAAEQTQGLTVTYKDKVILLPFSSWTDGKTRNYLDGHWNNSCDTDPQEKVSSTFPYLIGVSDTWGKHPSSSTCELASTGNHMVGISAHGALNVAADKNWEWDRILNHYITDSSTTKQY